MSRTAQKQTTVILIVTARNMKQSMITSKKRKEPRASLPPFTKSYLEELCPHKTKSSWPSCNSLTQKKWVYPSKSLKKGLHTQLEEFIMKLKSEENCDTGTTCQPAFTLDNKNGWQRVFQFWLIRLIWYIFFKGLHVLCRCFKHILSVSCYTLLMEVGIIA